MRQQFRETIDKEIGGIFGKAVAAKTVRHAANPGAGIARGLHINFGITDDHRLSGGGAKFPQNGFDALGIRLSCAQSYCRRK